MGKARNKLSGKSFNIFHLAYSMTFYSIKRIYTRVISYIELKKSIVLNGDSQIGIHHKTLLNLKNSKIIVNEGSLKIGIDFGYFDGGIYDSKRECCKIYLINSTLEIYGDVTLYPGAIIYAIDAHIIIRNDTEINKDVQIISLKKVDIGEGCRLAQGIIIRDNDGHIHSSGGDAANETQEVKIGNHCWIGQRAMILKGTNLADNVIVSAGAAVAGNFPSNVAIAGIPARIIKENVSWHA